MTASGVITDSEVCHGSLSPQITDLKLQHIPHSYSGITSTAAMLYAQIQPLVQKAGGPSSRFLSPASAWTL